jgi:hypothetical protein
MRNLNRMIALERKARLAERERCGEFRVVFLEDGTQVMGSTDPAGPKVYLPPVSPVEDDEN